MNKNNRLPVFRRLLLIAFFLPPAASPAQQLVDMDDAVSIALANHPAARNAALAGQKDDLMRQQAVDPAPVQVKYWQRNANAGNDRIWSVTQDFGRIPEYFRRSEHYRAVAAANRTERALTLDELAWQVKSAYLEAVYYRKRLSVMQEHDHYFEALIGTAEIRLAADSIAELAKVSAGARYAAYQSRMYIAEEEARRANTRLRRLMYVTDGEIAVSESEPELYQIHPGKAAAERFDPVRHQAAADARIDEAGSAVKLEKSRLYPAVHAGYIRWHTGGAGNLNGWMAGLSFPLWMQPQRARIRQAEIDLQAEINETEYRRFAGRQHIETLQSLLNGYFVQISFSSENLLVEAGLMLEEVEKSFSGGQITDYAAAFTKVHDAVSAKLSHLEYINLYNQTALELEYYTQ